MISMIFLPRRRQGRIRPEVSIRYDGANRDIFINTDRGRILRPLLVIEDGDLVLSKDHMDLIKSGEWTFSDLVSNGVVEWVDAEEEDSEVDSESETKALEIILSKD